MPLYEYRCKQCGHRFERIQSFSAEDVKECPVCKGEVERLISAPMVHFKGSGFYSTDYAAKPAASAKGDANSSPDGSSAPADKGGADKTPATKTESSPAASSSPKKSE
jgi:putative FmdB family regulatory protein